MTKEEQRKQWIDRVEEFKASGKTQAEWCKERNINIRTFNYWYCKFRNPENIKNSSNSWLSVKIENALKKTESSVISIKIGNAIIEISSGFDADHLSKVLRVLNSLC